MVLVCFGTAKQAILVFGKQQAARASDSHELTHEGAAAGCLIKGYEHTTEQSLGLWDTCLELSNQSNESSLCHYFYFASRFLAGIWGSDWVSECEEQGQVNGDERCPPQRRPPRSPGAGLLFFFVPLYLLVVLLLWRHLG